jgi:putative membrane protein (TIGR04086 family)
VTRRRTLDLRAIALGAGVALAISVPASLLAEALDDSSNVDDDSAVVFVAAAVVVVGLAAGGAVAAAHEPATSLRHGALAALVAFAVVAVVAVVRRAANDDDLGWASLGLYAVLALWAGVIGALASEARLTWRARR